VRLVIAQCTVDYVGRLTAHLPSARRLLLFKADGSVSVHADDRAYKPLNWMTPPCWTTEETAVDGVSALVWVVENKAGEQLRITVEDIEHDSSHELGVDPGLVKDGVEAHLQELLALAVHAIEEGMTLVRREYPTAIGPIDLVCRDRHGVTVAIEVKRRGDIDGVEQLGRYIQRLQLDSSLGEIRGVFVAQVVKPQARVLAEARGYRVVEIDYDELRGMRPTDLRLF
jgi:endonuclease